MRPSLYASLFSPNLKPTFYAPLLSDLLLKNGSGTATFSRATTATVRDFEGIIKSVKVGEARFEGARRVESLVRYTEDFSSAVWSKAAITVTPDQILSPAGTLTADMFTVTSAAGDSLRNNSAIAVVPGDTYVFSFYAKRGTMTENKYSVYSVTTTANIIAATSYYSKINAVTWTRVSVSFTVPAGCLSVYIYVERDSYVTGTFYSWGVQLENVSGQANQNPSEYVSVDVLTSTPYHGANIDGVKYFTTYNGNTVASNVVMEADGSPIPDDTLQGYLAEGPRTNLLLQSNTPVTQNISVTAQVYTVSMYDIGTCTLSGTGSGTLVGTEIAGRVQLTFTPTAGTLTLTFTGVNTKGQLEAGTFASSYMPTTSATVTRNADLLSYQFLENASAYEGSAYAEVKTIWERLQDSAGIISFNSIYGVISETTNGYSNTIAARDGTNLVVGAIANMATKFRKVAASWAQATLTILGEEAVPVSGAFDGSAGSTAIYIGGNSAGSGFCTVRNVKIWKKAVPKHQLIKLTRP